MRNMTEYTDQIAEIEEFRQFFEVCKAYELNPYMLDIIKHDTVVKQAIRINVRNNIYLIILNLKCGEISLFDEKNFHTYVNMKEIMNKMFNIISDSLKGDDV